MIEPRLRSRDMRRSSGSISRRAAVRNPHAGALARGGEGRRQACLGDLVSQFSRSRAAGRDRSRSRSKYRRGPSDEELATTVSFPCGPGAADRALQG